MTEKINAAFAANKARTRVVWPACALLLQLLGCSANASETAPRSPDSSPKTGTEATAPTDHRVILRPGMWKIRTREADDGFLAYHFFLGFNWTKLQIDYPDCSQIACRGLPESHRGCDHFCSTGRWREADLAIASARTEYDRAMASLNAVLNDLAALMDTRVGNRAHLKHGPVDKLLTYRGEVSRTNARVLDVMRSHRTLFENATKNIARDSPKKLWHTLIDSDRWLFGINNTGFTKLLNSWKSGAFHLAVQLNAVTFAFQAAHRILLSCAQGVLRSDMTGCEPGFDSEFYTDTPVASRLLSSSRLILVVKRESWKPMALSRWFMPFLDSSEGNRTCWLDRPMVSDVSSNYTVDYREPECDTRGLCESLELDRNTVSSCQVDVDGELSPGCPLVCGSRCFGPICYQPRTDSYTARAAAPDDADLVRVTNSPRKLSKAMSLSQTDIQGSLASMRNLSTRSYELLQFGEALLRDVANMDGDIRKYKDMLASNKVLRVAKWDRCEKDMARSQYIAATSLAFSAVSCCLWIVMVVKWRSNCLKLR